MSSLYQKRGIFYYQGKDEDGNRFQKSLRTRDRAEAREKKEKLDERFSTDTPTTLTKLVEDYLEHRRRKRDRDELSERTVGSDEYVLPFFLDWTQEKYGTVFSDEIGEISFSAFKEKRLENVSPTTVGKDLRHIQSFFSHASPAERGSFKRPAEVGGNPAAPSATGRAEPARVSGAERVAGRTDRRGGKAEAHASSDEACLPYGDAPWGNGDDEVAARS